jgi:multiple sugar transport system substrate-binding protein
MGAPGDPGLRPRRQAPVSRRARVLHIALAVSGAAALFVLAVSGCAKKPAGNVIVFWQFSPLPAIQPVIDRFEAANPGVDVQVEQLTWQSGREKIVAAIAAGRPPDLCELGSTFLPGLVADSTLVDLTDSTADLRSALVGWDVASYRGRAYAIPWMLGTRALFLNDDLLRRAGIDLAGPRFNQEGSGKPVETWAELRAVSRAVVERVPDAKGFGMNAGEREILFKKFMPFAWGIGGDILDSTMTRSVIASPQNIEALRFYLSLKPWSLLDRQEMHEEAFSKGRLGTVISGPWLVRRLSEQAPGLSYTVTLMPRPAAGSGTHASFAGAEVLGIFRGSRNRELALRLARFLVQPENTMPVFIATGNAFPAATASAADSYFVTHPRDRVFLDQLRTAVGPPLHPRWVEIEEIVNGELEEAIYGRKTADAALRSADTRINAILSSRP